MALRGAGQEGVPVLGRPALGEKRLRVGRNKISCARRPGLRKMEGIADAEEFAGLRGGNSRVGG